jgi:hypothetical protein
LVVIPLELPLEKQLSTHKKAGRIVATGRSGIVTREGQVVKTVMRNSGGLNSREYR